MPSIPHFMPIDPRDPGSIERALTRLNRHAAESLQDPRDPPVQPLPDPALLADAGIPAYVRALEACLSGDERMADRCAACDLPRAWHFDAPSQMILLGCGFAERVRQRPEIRSRGSVLPFDREPTISRRVFDALRDGSCGDLLTTLVSGFTLDELLHVARAVTNTVIAAQAEDEQ